MASPGIDPRTQPRGGKAISGLAKQDLGWLLLVVLVAFLWRVIFLRGGVPNVDLALKGDEGNYFGLARSFLDTGKFVDKWPWIRPPLYPMILATLLRAGGGNVLLAQVFQAAVGAASTAVVYVIVRRELGKREARLAGVGLALDPTAPLTVQYLFAEGIATFFNLLASLMLVEGFLGRKKWLWFALAGTALGLGLLSRASGVPFIVLVVVWLLVKGKGAFWIRLAQAATLIVALCIVLSPWTIRNWTKFHRLIPVDTTLGVNVYQHNGPLSRTQVYAELMRIRNPGDRDAYALHKAMAWIVENPVTFALRALDRLSHSWTADRYTEWDIALRARYPAAASWLSLLYASAGTLWFLSAVFLGALGIAVTRGSHYRTIFLLMATANMATAVFVESVFRYRLAFVPFVVPLAAAAIYRLRWNRSVILWGVAGVAAVVLSLPALLPAWPRDMAANTLYLAGRAADAAGLAHFSNSLYSSATAMEDRPDFVLATAIQLSRQAKYDAAFAILRSAQQKWPEDPRIPTFTLAIARQADVVPPAGPFGMVGLWAEEWAWDHIPLPPRSTVRLGTDDLGHVRGFYGVERSGDRTFRWSSSRAWVRLWTPATRGRLMMLCSAGGASAQRVDVSLAGVRVGTMQVPPGPWQRVSLRLPGVYRQAQLLTIVLDIPGAMRRGNDPRQLGVQVSEVQLVPADGP